MDDPNRSSLALLYSITRELSSSLELNEVLDKVARLSADSLGAERCTLVALDTEGRPAAVAFVAGGEALALSEAGVNSTLARGLAGWVLRSGQEALIADTSLDARWLVRPDDLKQSVGGKSALCIPLTAREQVVGVMTMVHPQPDFFTQEHLELLKSIAAQAGMFIHNALLYDSLQHATRRYRELFDDSLLPLVISDRAGNVVEANRQAGLLLGLEAGAAGGNLFDLHTLPEGLEPAGLADGETHSFEAEVKRGEGVTPVEVHLRPASIEGRALLQWTLIDRSERKALDALRDDLIAMVYHDLRSPLSNIVSSLDLLAVYLPPKENAEVQSLYSIATRSAARLQRLISSLLDLYRLESGEVTLHHSEINLTELVAEAAEAVRPTVEAKGQTLYPLIGSLPVRLTGDADMLRRVLTNLVENAAKYTPAHGELWIGVETQKNWVKLWVQDSGPGIPAEAREAIFQKFARLQPERTPQGIGLGLTFCRLAVQAHGGRIWVENPGGKGSRFIFTLPCD